MGAIVEIIIFIIVAVAFYIFISPFINTFGSDSPLKNSGKITKTKEALKQVGSNYRETKKAISKGWSAIEKGVDTLEKESRTWPEKAEKFRLEQYEKGYQRGKATVAEVNKKYRKLGLKEVSLIDFFEYNKDYQERARREIEDEKQEERARVLETKRCEVKARELLTEKTEIKTQEFEAEKNGTKINELEIDESREITEQVTKIIAEHKKSLTEVTETQESQRQKNKAQEIDLTKVPHALIEFIYIRYYLTGETSLPKLKCIYNCWRKSIYADSTLNEDQWDKIIEKMSFNPIKRKKIDALYHFTHKDNLSSILLNGLLTKKTLEEQKIEYKYNDEKRLEGIKDSISLSFSHPNWKMFYKYRCLTNQNDWVVLKISPELLSGNTDSSLKELNEFDYLDKAIFCKKNAAHFTERTKTAEERKSHKVFLDIFESTIDIELLTYPYLNESEILFQSNIPKEFIKEIYIVEEDQNLAWVRDLGFKLSVNKIVFDKR